MRWRDPPPRKGPGGRTHSIRPACLIEGRVIESALLANPRRWAEVDRQPVARDGFGGSAVYMRLFRYGFEVVARREGDEYVVFGRWPHDTPWEAQP